METPNSDEKNNNEKLFNLYIKNGQTDKAFELITQLAEGDIEAKFTQGIMYFYGEGTKINYEEAFKCFKEASNQGVTEAYVMMGICNKNGFGTKKNEQLAIKLFLQAEKQGSVEATINLIEYRKSGIIDEISERVFNNILKTAEVKELTNLGIEFLNSEIPECFEKGFMCLNKAADGGDINALLKLADMYQNGKFVDKDIKKAYEYHKKAFESNRNSQYASLATENLAYLALIAEDKPDCNMSIYYYNESYRLGNKRNKYNLDILNDLNGREIRCIDNTSELNIEDINKEKVGAVFIKSKINNRYDHNTLYSVENYIRCKETIDFILEDVDKVSETRDNELDVFMQIYVKLGKMIKYDRELNELDQLKSEQFYTGRNLVGGLLKRKKYMYWIC